MNYKKYSAFEIEAIKLKVGVLAARQLEGVRRLRLEQMSHPKKGLRVMLPSEVSARLHQGRPLFDD